MTRFSVTFQVLGCVAAALAACAPPTATPTPMPTPTPVDPVSAFKTFSQRKDVEGHAVLSSTMSIGAVEIPISGTLMFDGDDWAMTMATSVADEDRVVQERWVKGAKYRSVDDGPWLKLAAPSEAAKQGAMDVARAVDEVENAGEVDRDDIPGLAEAVGEGPLYELRPSDDLSLPPAMLGIDDTTASMMTDLETELSLYVAADGSLVAQRIGLEWAPAIKDGLPGALEMMLVIEDYDAADIDAPADPWGHHVADAQRFAVGVPPGYKAKPDEDDDTLLVLLSPTGDRGLVWTFDELEEPADLTEFTAEMSQWLGAELDSKAEDGGAVTMGGQPGRLLSFEITDDDGGRWWLMVGAVVRSDGGAAYMVTHPYTEDPTFAKRPFRRLLSTFELLPAMPDQSGDNA